MKDIWRDFRFHTIGFALFMIASAVFAFLRPMEDCLPEPNRFLACGFVILATVFLSMAFFDQGFHAELLAVTPPPVTLPAAAKQERP